MKRLFKFVSWIGIVFVVCGTSLFGQVKIPWQPGQEFSWSTNFYVKEVGEEKNLSIAPADPAHYKFKAKPTATTLGLEIIQRSTTDFSDSYKLRIVDVQRQGSITVRGAIVPYGQGSGGGPRQETPFHVSMLQRLVSIFHLVPEGGTNLWTGLGCTNDLTAEVVMGNLTPVTTGEVKWTSGGQGSFINDTVALQGGKASTKFVAPTSGSQGTITATGQQLKDSQGLTLPNVSTNLTYKILTMKLDIEGVPDADEETVGGVVVRNAENNKAPRKKITLQRDPLSWVGDVILTRSSPNIKVFTAASGGTEITFNGQDNKFPTTSLPKTLYVEGYTASTKMRDVILTLSADKVQSTADRVRFTVLWVEPSIRFDGHASNDNAARGAYKDWTGTFKLGPFLNQANLTGGNGVEIVGVVKPSDFTGAIVFHRYFKSVAAYINDIPIQVPQPGTDDTSDPPLRDDDPQSGKSQGRIYDLDAPSSGFMADDPPGKTSRSRVNFEEWAVFDDGVTKIRCSRILIWFARHSVIRTKKGIGFLNDVANDNQQGEGTTPLTIDLK